MPKDVFGIGTREYGRREASPDGSCITTKFYVFLYIPLWPVNSRQIRVYRQKQVVDILAQGLCWPQVLKVLAVGYGICLTVLVVLGSVLLWAFGPK